MLVLMLTATGAFSTEAFTALQNRSSGIALTPKPHNYIRMPDVIAPSDALTQTPLSGWAWLYMDSDALKFKNDSGVTTSIANPEYAVQLASLFVDSVGPITAASAPNLATTDNVGAVVYDDSSEVAEVQFHHYASAGFKGLEIRIGATSDTASSSGQAMDWSIMAHDGTGSAIATVVAQTGASFASSTMDASIDEITLTLDAAGIAAITPGTTVLNVNLFNAGTTPAAVTLEIKYIKVREL